METDNGQNGLLVWWRCVVSLEEKSRHAIARKPWSRSQAGSGWIFQHLGPVTTDTVARLWALGASHPCTWVGRGCALRLLAPTRIICQAVFLSNSQMWLWAIWKEWDMISRCRIICLKRHHGATAGNEHIKSDRILAVTDPETWSLAFQPNQVGWLGIH